jgi:hypothetical protein
VTSTNYETIRQENERRYGTDIGRIGPMLLSDRYADRTHFIFELLQNTEDALARSARPHGSRAINFELTKTSLRVTHMGKAFDEADVRGICGIGESTKSLTEIGRFGIGFKSVYAFTDRPEIHSGDEDFAIESYVWPVAAPSIEREAGATVLLLPLRPGDDAAHTQIAAGLERLGASALLFLHQIEEIRWSVEGGRSGRYTRKNRSMGPGARLVKLADEERATQGVSQDWLVLSRPVATQEGRQAGLAEIAFSAGRDAKQGRRHVRAVDRSVLVAFFATALETHLGFLVQGPYRTTPSRDNVPIDDPWNQRLVGETADLLVHSLHWLRDHGWLDTMALTCLPIDGNKFGESSMFAPVFEATKSALRTEELLPRADRGFVPASRARLGRTEELRELFGPAQLAQIHGQEGELAWLSGDITQDRSPILRRYLMQDLGVSELTPEVVIPLLRRPFLSSQPDAWILRLYEFLNGQPALRRRLDEIPLIRLQDGSHVPASAGGQPLAFLPGAVSTGFPAVRRAVCSTEPALEFLRSLGLTEPDPVDDVIRNVLPRYRKDNIDVDLLDYPADIDRISGAFGTDSKAQREKLVSALRETKFVMAVAAGSASRVHCRPDEAYLPTERLRALFAGVQGVLLVDDANECLRGGGARELLEACGVARSLRPEPAHESSSSQDLTDIRRKAGLERATWESRISDVTLRGLGALLALLPQLSADSRRERAALLWDALADIAVRSGSGVFEVRYMWGYSHEIKTASFDAAFVRQLNDSAWIPTDSGELRRPADVSFESLGWAENPLLQSKIQFKPPAIEALAREAGIEIGALDLLKRFGLTNEAELAARLGLSAQPAGVTDDHGIMTAEEATRLFLGDTPGPTPPGSVGQEDMRGPGNGHGGTHGNGPSADTNRGGRVDTGRHGCRAGASGGHPFISYIGTHPDDDPLDPDGLGNDQRMELEAAAIALIASREPAWRGTPARNPGYDLFQADENGRVTRWCEVKAMTGSLEDRPVGLSRAQFDCAREHSANFWLYVVEHAGTPHEARIVRIQDPAGRARTFTFDHGWLSVADVATVLQTEWFTPGKG